MPWDSGGGSNNIPEKEEFRDPFDTDLVEDGRNEHWEDEANATFEGDDNDGSDNSRNNVNVAKRAMTGLPPAVGLGGMNGTIGQKEPASPDEIREKFGMGLCVIEGAINTVQGGIIGSLFGAVQGMSEGYSHQLRGRPLMQHAWYRTRTSALQFGLWVGAYRGTKCSMIVGRNGKKDVLNPLVAGWVAGAIPALPTGNPRVIFWSAMGSGLLMAGIDIIEGMIGGH